VHKDATIKAVLVGVQGDWRYHDDSLLLDFVDENSIDYFWYSRLVSHAIVIMNSSTGRGIRVPPHVSKGTVVVNQLKGEKRKRYASPSDDEIEESPLAQQSRRPSSLLSSHGAEAGQIFDGSMAPSQDNESIEGSQADHTEETEIPESEEQRTPTQSREVVRSPIPIRQYAQRERPALNYSSQMSKVAYPRSYRQYQLKPIKSSVRLA
jgi:hypothetical protein